MKTVAIIGAGIIGLMSAYELKRCGYDVVIVDKGSPGGGCSLRNTGWITLSLSRPLPGPDVILASLRWLFKSDSPLFIQPTAVLRLAPWLIGFWCYCNRDAFRRGVAALASLAKGTMAAFDSLRAQGLEFEMYENGLLYVSFDERVLENKMLELAELGELGFTSPTVLTKSEVRDLEPNLSPEIVGGILVAGERHIRPESLNSALVDWLRSTGVRVVSDEEVTGFVLDDTSVRAALTNGDKIEADKFVLSAGVATGALVRKLHTRLPLVAGKGYSLTLHGTRNHLSRPIYFEEARIAVSQFGQDLRFAGTMELSNLNNGLEIQRLHGIERSARRCLRDWEGRRATYWAGLRPLTPDGLPVIGRLPKYENVVVATGHGMLGVTLAPSTAREVTALIAGTSGGVAAFAPNRFGNWM